MTLDKWDTRKKYEESNFLNVGPAIEIYRSLIYSPGLVHATLLYKLLQKTQKDGPEGSFGCVTVTTTQI